MSLEQHGVIVDCEVDASGRLLVNLVTDREVRVTVNSQPPKPDAGPVRASKFWSADGTQTDVAPLDLRGEER